jgi:hypothetical protein
MKRSSRYFTHWQSKNAQGSSTTASHRVVRCQETNRVPLFLAVFMNAYP